MLRILSIFIIFASCTAETPCKYPPKPTYSNCCNHPKLLDNRDFEGCDRSKSYKNQATSVCAEYECFFTKTGLFKNETLQMAAIQSYMIKLSREFAQMSPLIDWQSVISGAVEVCVDKIFDMREVLRELFSQEPFKISPSECDVTFVATINCVYYDIFVNCPQAAWERTRECDDWQDHINTCMNDIETFPHIDMNKMYNP
ncbi:general odorant-binding protein 66-like [Culicoides brevitarsis]|uniref:general odorant-binding protein 66-like n=1 Tax=Culicoides brevitarsis TaxID=469753 RepID=UPI00307C6EDB